MRNSECGMRKEKNRTEVFEFGIGNAECGILETVLCPEPCALPAEP